MASVQQSGGTLSADMLAALNGTSGSSGSGKKTSEMGAAEDRFLRLLTTQLQNQDPLNPMDNAAVTSQLAQINTVTGIEKLNTTMTQLLGGYDDSQQLAAASMIGRDVLVPGRQLTLGQNGAIGGIELSAPADSVKLSITDANGLVVDTIDLGARDAGTFAFAWDGKTSGDVAAAPGNYTITVSAVQGGKAVTAQPLEKTMVLSVIKETNGFSLDLGTAGRVRFDDVKQIL